MSDKLGFFSNRICDEIANIFGEKTIDDKIFWGQNILATARIDINILTTEYIDDRIYWWRNILMTKYIDDKPGSLIVGHSHKKSVWNSPPNPHHAKPTLDAFIGADWNGLSTSPPRFRMRHIKFSGSDCAGSSIGPEIVIKFSGHVPIEIQFSLNSKSSVRSLESNSIVPVPCLIDACPCHKLTDWQCLKNFNLM